MKCSLVLSCTLIACLLACGGDPPAPVVKTVTVPSLAVSPASLTLTAGSNAIPLHAVLAGASDAITWTLEGPGVLSATQGESVSYTAPVAEGFDVEATARLTVTAGEASATVAISVHPLVKEWGVDVATGSDDNPGTAAQPFKTLKKALSVAGADQTVTVQDGHYDLGTGEEWPARVPVGVTIRGATPSGVVLAGGPEQTAFVFDGAARVDAIVFEGFSAAVSASQSGELILNGLTSHGARFLLGGTANAVILDLTLDQVPNHATAVYLRDVAHLSMSATTLSGLGAPSDCTGSEGISLIHSATVNLVGVDLSHFGGSGLFARDSTEVTGGDVTLTDTGRCSGSQVYADGASTIRLNGLTIRDGGGNGITIRDSANQVAVDNLIMGNHPDDGIYMTGGHLTLTDANIANSQNGIYVNPGAFVEYAGGALVENQIGLQSVGSNVSLRGVMIYGGERALVVDNRVDLGTASDPGLNSFKASTTVLYLQPGGTYPIQAVGNTWEINQQGSDAQGHYASQLLTGPVSGRNFNLVGTSSIQL